MSEFLWNGLSLAVKAKNGYLGPIDLGSCMDFRRISKNVKDTAFICNVFTNFVLAVLKSNTRMTIGNVCNEFRRIFNLLKENDWFFKEYLFPLNYFRGNACIPIVSNVGPMKFKELFKDFYLQVSSKDQGMIPYIGMTSYEK